MAAAGGREVSSILLVLLLLLKPTQLPWGAAVLAVLLPIAGATVETPRLSVTRLLEAVAVRDMAQGAIRRTTVAQGAAQVAMQRVQDRELLVKAIMGGIGQEAREAAAAVEVKAQRVRMRLILMVALAV